MQIEGRTATTVTDYLNPVTYIPSHANGDINHRDVEKGVIIRISGKSAFILFCKSRTVQSVSSANLIWG